MFKFDLSSPNGNHTHSFLQEVKTIGRSILSCCYMKGSESPEGYRGSRLIRNLVEDSECAICQIDLSNLETSPLSPSDSELSVIQNLFKRHSPWSVI